MVTYNIRLGPQETKLLFSLEENGVSVFTTEDAKKILASGSASTWSVVSGLKKKGRVRQVERGKYLLIPARAGVEGYWAESPWVIVPHLIDVYYVGFWTAMNYWGMTEQIPYTVFVATTKRKKKRILKFGNQKFEFVTLSKKKFFGFVEQKASKAETFNISSKEKTIIDGLTHPEYCGGMPEVAKAMWNARDDVSWSAVLEMSKRSGVGAVLRRLGYLLSILDIEQGIANDLKNTFKGYHFLDPNATKEILDYSKEYGLIINRSRNRLLGWREY